MGLFVKAFEEKLEEAKPELFEEKKKMARVFQKAMTYRFKLNDIGKYSSSLKCKDTTWRFQRSATGKYKIPLHDDSKKKEEEPVQEPEAEQEEVKKEFDWADTPLYEMYERHGRWMHQDKNIFSDVECKILHSHFKSMGNIDDDNEDDI